MEKKDSILLPKWVFTALLLGLELFLSTQLYSAHFSTLEHLVFYINIIPLISFLNFFINILLNFIMPRTRSQKRKITNNSSPAQPSKPSRKPIEAPSPFNQPPILPPVNSTMTFPDSIFSFSPHTLNIIINFNRLNIID
jgi:hypothetical protein